MSDTARPVPPYLRILAEIRRQILSGAIADGDQVPSVRQIADSHGVAHATASRVISSLRSQGLVRTEDGVGTFATIDTVSYGPRDRFMSMRRSGAICPPGEASRIVSAELVDAPQRVCDALGLPAGCGVIRRHRITGRGDVPVCVSTSWFDGALAASSPLLLSTERLPQGTPAYIEETTGRTAWTGHDQFAARFARNDEARDLDLAPGDAVLYGCNWLYDADGAAIEYGEYVSLPDTWQHYDYDLPVTTQA